MYYVSKLVWFVFEPSNFLLLLVLAGGLLGWTRFWKAGRVISVLAALALFCGGILPLANLLLAPLENRFPVFVDDGKPVHGVVILGGALMTEPTIARGRMELNEAAERLTALIPLIRRYPQARIVFTGGAGELTGTSVAEAEALEKVMGDLLDNPKILYERVSRNTYENAVFSHLLARPRDDERWLLVTSAWHMPRSVGLFRKAGWVITPYPVDFRTSGTADDWRLSGSVSGGLRRVDVAVKEWVGLLFAWLTGQSAAFLPG